MKKYIFSAFVALAAMIFTSCDDKFEATTNGHIQVSTSYVSIPTKGDSTFATITLTTDDSFTISGVNAKDTIPGWLKITPKSGAAGTTQVTFSAAATEDGRSTENVVIRTANDSLRIFVVQGESKVAEATCAEVLAGPDGKTFRTKGVVTAIANTVYGNFYINDGTGEVYIYGTLYDGKTQNNPIVNNNIEVGDEVTVEGPKKTYNGTVELVDVAVVSVSKSLIKVDSVNVENNVISSDGGDFEVYLVNKGEGLYVDVPEDVQSWLTIKSIAGNKVLFNAKANTAGPRNATLVFKTMKDGKEYTAQTSLTQEGLSGTLDVPFTVAEAIAYAKKLGSESTQDYYIKGKVSRIASAFGAQYGNGTFWISDDGTESVSEDGKTTTNTDHDFEVFRALWLGNQKWADGNAALSVGDEVIICGKITLYNGLAETSSGKAYVYSVNGLTTDVNGLGSLSSPLNVAGAIAAAKAGATANVYVSGKVTKVQSQFSAQYGNGTFWISDDGNDFVSEDMKSTANTDHDFEVYRALWLGNQKWVEGDATVAAGDNVVIYGALTLYNGIAETASGKAYVYTHNGVTK